MEWCATPISWYLFGGWLELQKIHFQRDINRPRNRYEGQFSFYIYSDFDFVVGQQCCGKFCAALKNANGASGHDKLDHGSVLTTTKNIQFAMVNHQNYDNFAVV